MIQEIVSVGLPVDERWKVIKNRLEPEQDAAANQKRICIITGTHGDELEGQYVCYELTRRIQAHKELLQGIVDIYPAINPLGIDSISRSVPMFDLDMNRIFPGTNTGASTEYAAAQVIADINGADMAIDIHASDIFLHEIPQVRINTPTAEQLLPYAKLLNMDFIWADRSETVCEGTLAYSLNASGTPCLVVEMGVGMRITKGYAMRLVDGIFRLMCEMGIWAGDAPEVCQPIISYGKHISLALTEESGIFIPAVQPWAYVNKGDTIGNIVYPATGEILHTVKADASGKVFTLREYPVVYAGSLIARILDTEYEEGQKNDEKSYI